MLVMLLNTFLAVEWNPLNKIFGTGDLTTVQRIMCFLAALPLLLLWEIAKFIQRRRIASGKVEAPELVGFTLPEADSLREGAARAMTSSRDDRLEVILS